MKQIITIILGIIMAATIVNAGVGNIDQECQAHDFDFGIAKWEYSDNGFFLESTNSDYNTAVTGDDSHAYWTSSPDAAGILSKEGQDYQILAGGSNGEVFQGDHGISHVTLCGNEEYNEVPEFSIFAALGVVALAGLFILKRR